VPNDDDDDDDNDYDDDIEDCLVCMAEYSATHTRQSSI
jgi:hypothetical protein